MTHEHDRRSLPELQSQRVAVVRQAAEEGVQAFVAPASTAGVPSVPCRLSATQRRKVRQVFYSVSSSKAQDPAGLQRSPFSYIVLFFLIYLRLDGFLWNIVPHQLCVS